MKIIRAATQLWHRIILGIRLKLHSQAWDTARGHQTKVSVNAAKYLGRLSPELYHQVVNRCRIQANRQDNLITEEMVRTVVKIIYNEPNASGGSVNAKRRTG